MAQLSRVALSKMIVLSRCCASSLSRITRTRRSRLTLFLLLVLLILYLLFTYQVNLSPSDKFDRDSNAPLPPEGTSDNSEPILIWWTPFTPYKRIIKSCPKGRCLITHSRTEYTNPRTESIIFYGSDLRWTDLPLPRNTDHHWALLHEESPKNNWGFAYEEGISLFNVTSTPSRYSSFPLVTQYLEDIQNLARPLKYPMEEKSKGDIGLVMYLHSDCDPPSDRDSYVKELMKYVKVDSYGKCLHNKDLPEHLRDPITGMSSEDLLNIIGQYKFTLAMENAICNDYITEKFWRPLYAGSVPIVKGSPTIKDWAPNDHSIILIDDYSSPKELADYLLYLDKHDDEYENYLTFKQYGVTNLKLLDAMNERAWSVNNYSPGTVDHIDAFECYVCDRAIEKKTTIKEGHLLQPSIANNDHFKCEFPKPLVKREKRAAWWMDMLLVWRQVAAREKERMTVIKEVIKQGKGQDEVTNAYDNTKVQDSKEYRLSSDDYIDSVDA